jgi:hypothetical protein
MRKTWLLVVAVLTFGWTASSQAAANSQSSASADSRVSASAGQSNAQAQSNSSAAASGKAQASDSKKGSQTSGSAAGSASHSSAASASAGPASLDISSGTTLNADLLTTVDARKNKPGDRVVARTTSDVKQGGHVVLRKGTKLIGHVTQAQARSKGSSESSLGVVFDQAVMKNGQEAPIHLAIQALAASQSAASAALAGDDAMGSVGAVSSASSAGRSGGLASGVGSTVNGAAGATGNAAGNLGRAAGSTVDATARTASSAAGNARGLDAAGQLASSSTGVFGLRGLSLNSELSNATQGSVVSSSSQNVHLDSGTQMVLRVISQ